MCLGFLNKEAWLATGSISQILSAIYSLMIKPELEHIFDQELYDMYQYNHLQYDAAARASAQRAN